ncbi:hypothetical protein A9E74_02318 [Methylophaga muralis]|uniref:Uncharacterized protein n=1 Tax=Methylophaga muralis TaxID=291169 RepID=A0A1E3GPJ4_9GAMM|nr:hypothetical protein A9E74_02318 [Methylophaga muralis]
MVIAGLEIGLFERSEFFRFPCDSHFFRGAAGQHKGCLFFWFVFFDSRHPCRSPFGRLRRPNSFLMNLWANKENELALRRNYAFGSFSLFKLIFRSRESGACVPKPLTTQGHPMCWPAASLRCSVYLGIGQNSLRSDTDQSLSR